MNKSTPTTVYRLALAGALLLVACSTNQTTAGSPSAPASSSDASLSLQIDQARQATGYRDPSDNLLELSVTLTNAEGSGPVLLDPLLFHLKTSSGLLVTPTLVTSYRWINGMAPDPSTELAGGGSFNGFPLAFKVAAADAVELDYTPPSGTAGGITVGDARSASAQVVVEACTSCGSACIYEDVDTTTCCDPIPVGGSCESHVARCPSGKTKCGALCADVHHDEANCGACGVVVPQGGFCNSGVASCGSATKCGGSCVDLTGDKNNCGACGNACPGAIACTNGKCDGSVSFSAAQGKSCDTECATLGATCSDTGGFECNYDGAGSLGSGSCGGLSGHHYDTTCHGIPGCSGGSMGTSWVGIKCAAPPVTSETYFSCHCVK